MSEESKPLDLIAFLAEVLNGLETERTYTGDEVLQTFLEPLKDMPSGRETAEEEYIDFLEDLDYKHSKQLNHQREKLKNQRRQLSELQEKVEAMRTWKGIFRTIRQRMGIGR